VGRPSLGDQARNIQQGTKVSKDEIKWLEGLHGSAHKGLRAALDFYKLETLRHTEGAEDYAAALDTFAPEPKWVPPADYRPIVDVELPEEPKPTGPRPVVPVDADGTPVLCRIHRKWETISEFYDKGVAMREKRCVACGHISIERAG
jgi:hypothetical protein